MANEVQMNIDASCLVIWKPFKTLINNSKVESRQAPHLFGHNKQNAECKLNHVDKHSHAKSLEVKNKCLHNFISCVSVSL